MCEKQWKRNRLEHWWKCVKSLFNLGGVNLDNINFAIQKQEESPLLFNNSISFSKAFILKVGLDISD